MGGKQIVKKFHNSTLHLRGRLNLTSLKSPARVIPVHSFFSNLCNLFLLRFQSPHSYSEVMDSLCVTEGNCSNAGTAQPTLVLASCCNSLTTEHAFSLPGINSVCKLSVPNKNYYRLFSYVEINHPPMPSSDADRVLFKTPNLYHK